LHTYLILIYAVVMCVLQLVIRSAVVGNLFAGKRSLPDGARRETVQLVERGISHAEARKRFR